MVDSSQPARQLEQTEWGFVTAGCGASIAAFGRKWVAQCQWQQACGMGQKETPMVPRLGIGRLDCVNTPNA
jgi:hypothetical protein